MKEIKFRAWYENKMCYNICVADERTILKLGHSSFNAIDCSDIMQYIGVKDKNGKEIYEGDLVECIAKKAYERDSGVYPIEYFVDEQRFAPNWVCHLGWGGWDSIEVVGNVYENPELLKV